MPYTKNDYPNTMKNLDEITRLKALDILNAMLKNDYKEEDAIPISISQAKDWKDKASEADIKELKQKDITKHTKDKSDSARLADRDVIVYYEEAQKEWAVKSKGAKRVSNYFKTKKEALEKAEHIAKNKDSEVIAHKKSD